MVYAINKLIRLLPCSSDVHVYGFKGWRPGTTDIAQYSSVDGAAECGHTMGTAN